jgi:hypothetical protein
VALAGRLHAADRRQREPYADYLLRVAIRILSHYRVTASDVAALLHDAVEDHAAGLAPGGTRHAASFGAERRFLLAANGRPLCRDRTALTQLNPDFYQISAYLLVTL